MELLLITPGVNFNKSIKKTHKMSFYEIFIAFALGKNFSRLFLLVVFQFVYCANSIHSLPPLSLSLSLYLSLSPYLSLLSPPTLSPHSLSPPLSPPPFSAFLTHPQLVANAVSFDISQEAFKGVGGHFRIIGGSEAKHGEFRGQVSGTNLK